MSEDDGTITLADGTVIDMMTGKPRRDNNGALPGHIVVPTARDAVAEVTRVRRRLADLPDMPEKMNVVAVVCAYYMFGLDDWEIAHAIGGTERQVGNIRMTAAFSDLVEMMQRNIVEGQEDSVRTALANNAHLAVNTIVNGLSSDDEKVQLVAAKDILDRSGHRPNDVVEHRHKVEGGLTIEYVSKSDSDHDMPMVDVTPRGDN